MKSRFRLGFRGTLLFVIIASTVVMGVVVGTVSYQQTKSILRISEYNALNSYLESYEVNLLRSLDELKEQIDNFSQILIAATKQEGVSEEDAISRFGNPRLQQLIQKTTEERELVDFLLITKEGDIVYSANGNDFEGRNIVRDFPDSAITSIYEDFLVLWRDAQNEDGTGGSLVSFGDVEKFIGGVSYFPVIGTHLDYDGKLVGFNVALFPINVFGTHDGENILGFKSARILLFGNDGKLRNREDDADVIEIQVPEMLNEIVRLASDKDAIGSAFGGGIFDADDDDEISDSPATTEDDKRLQIFEEGKKILCLPSFSSF